VINPVVVENARQGTRGERRRRAALHPRRRGGMGLRSDPVGLGLVDFNPPALRSSRLDAAAQQITRHWLACCLR
jgi:hypothetical protein